MNERDRVSPTVRAVTVIGLGVLLLAIVIARFISQNRDPVPPVSVPVVQWRDKTLRAGDRVRILRWAGTFKPIDTGHRSDVDADAGRTGTVLRGEPRPDTWHHDADRQEPIQIVRVRWSPQRWKENGRDTRVALDAFEATIHVEYLELVRE